MRSTKARPARRHRRDRIATLSVVSPQRADGCFTPAMQEPSRSRPEASATLPLLYAIGRPPRARIDRRGSAVGAIGSRVGVASQARPSAGLARLLPQLGPGGSVMPMPRKRSPARVGPDDRLRVNPITTPANRDERSPVATNALQLTVAPARLYLQRRCSTRSRGLTEPRWLAGDRDHVVRWGAA